MKRGRYSGRTMKGACGGRNGIPDRPGDGNERLPRGVAVMLTLSGILNGVTATRHWVPDAISQSDFGVFMAATALLILVTGLRSYPTEKSWSLLHSLMLTLAPAWVSLGLTHLSQSFSFPQPGLAQSFPVIHVYIVVSANVHVILGVLGKVGHVAILSTITALTQVLKIISFYDVSDQALGVASLSILHTVVAVFLLVKEGISFVQGMDQQVQVQSRPRLSNPSQHIVMIGTMGCHLLSLLPFLVLSIDSSLSPFEVALTIALGGLFQVIMGVTLLRYQESFQSFVACFHGVTWSSTGISLLLGDRSLDSFTGISIPVGVFIIVTSVLVVLVSLGRSVVDIVHNALFGLQIAALMTTGFNGKFFSVLSWLLVFSVLYKFFLRGHGILQKTNMFPEGQKDRILREFLKCLKGLSCSHGKDSGNPCAPTATSDKLKNSFLPDVDEDVMGYSKYANLEMLGFLLNSVAAVSHFGFDEDKHRVLGVTWVVVAGGLVQMVVGSVCFSRGQSFQSCVFLLFSAFWLVSDSARSLVGFFSETHAVLALGPFAFIVLGLVLVLVSLTVSKSWTVFLILMLVDPIFALLDMLRVDTNKNVEIVLVTLLCLAGFYCFLSHGTRVWWGFPLVPEGHPLVNIRLENEMTRGKEVVMAPARTLSGIRKIADILNAGGVAAIPTDTVYILCAACKNPEAVERAYKTKKQAEDRPMSLWISDLSQIECARSALGPRTWSFMQKVWPSSISCVIPKGEWLYSLGLGDSVRYLGRPDSIAVRLPDYTVTTHLIQLIGGPIAVTSANPSGEADTTHHAQVLARLGTKNVDGILCAGPSPENTASTVVDLRRIAERHIGFFRVGVTPRSRVHQLFQEVLQEEHVEARKDIDVHVLSESRSVSKDSSTCSTQESETMQKNLVLAWRLQRTISFEEDLELKFMTQNGNRSTTNGSKQSESENGERESHQMSSQSFSAKDNTKTVMQSERFFSIEEKYHRDSDDSSSMTSLPEISRSGTSHVITVHENLAFDDTETD